MEFAADFQLERWFCPRFAVFYVRSDRIKNRELTKNGQSGCHAASHFALLAGLGSPLPLDGGGLGGVMLRESEFGNENAAE